MFTKEDLHTLTASQRKSAKTRAVVRHIAKTTVIVGVYLTACTVLERAFDSQDDTVTQ